MNQNTPKDKIIEAAEMLGFNNKMSAVYLATLELGGAGVADISKLSVVERVNTYYVLEQLKRDGFVYSGFIKKKIAYFAENPQKLLEAMELKTKKFSNIIPELMAIQNSHATKPTIRFYEGIEGMKKVFNETLLLPRGSETLAFASYHTVAGHLQEFVPDFIERRAAKNISQRCIAEDTQLVRDNLIANDERDKRETRMVDKDKFPFEVDQLNIFGNKLFIASYTDMMALVIESPAIAKTMRSIFELAWLNAHGAENSLTAASPDKADKSDRIQRTTQKVMFEREGKILMVKDTKGQWELPGGTIDFGEEIEAALHREIAEEMGLNRDQYEVHEMRGNFNIIRHVNGKHYHFLVLVYRGELKVDEFKLSDEHTESAWLAIPQILELKMVEGYREFFEKLEMK